MCSRCLQICRSWSPALSLVVLCLLGMAIQRWLIRPIQNGPALSLAMMAIAVGYFLRGGATLLWGREILPFPHVYPDHAFLVGSVILTTSDLTVTGSVAALLALLWLIFVATPIGRTAQ